MTSNSSRYHDQLETGLANTWPDEKALLYSDEDPQYTRPSHRRCQRSGILTLLSFLGLIFVISVSIFALFQPCSLGSVKDLSPGRSASKDETLIRDIKMAKAGKVPILRSLKGRQVAGVDPSPISTPGNGAGLPTTTLPADPPTEPTSTAVVPTDEPTSTSDVPPITTTDPTTSQDPTTSNPPPPPPVTTTSEDVTEPTPTVPTPTTTGTSTTEAASSISPLSTTQTSTSTSSSSPSNSPPPDTAPASSVETAIPTSTSQTTAPGTTSSSVEPSSTTEESSTTTAEPTSTEPVSSTAVKETVVSTIPGGGKKTITATSYVEVEPTAKPEENANDDPSLQDAASSLSWGSVLAPGVALMAGFILVV